MKNFNGLFNRWKKDELKKLHKQERGSELTKAKRTYIHFDKRRHTSSLIDLEFKKILNDPDQVVKSAFWPFLRITLEDPRIKNAKKGKVRKKEIKKRNVYYAAHRDAIIYSWYSFILNTEYYEPLLKKLGLDASVTAYRKIPLEDNKRRNKCNIHFAKEVFEFIKKKNEKSVAIVSDITGFFDSLNHEHLKKEWLRVLDIQEYIGLPKDHKIIYNNLTKFKYVDVEKVYEIFNIKFKKVVHKTQEGIKIFKVPTRNGEKIDCILEPKRKGRKDFFQKILRKGLIKGNNNFDQEGRLCGIMQGSPISATLSNIYMISFDEIMFNLVKSIGGLYRRYSDDLVVICDEKDHLEIKNKIFEEIKNFELEINEKKTDVTFFRKDRKGNIRGFVNDKDTSPYKNMQYLGFEFNGIDAFIRSKSLTKYYRKMKMKIRKAVSMAFGKSSKTKDLNNIVFKKKLYEKFILGGKRSFISYALRADKVIGNSSIKKQLGNRFGVMKKYIDKKRNIRLSRLYKKSNRY